MTLEQYEEHFRRLSNADSTDIVLNIGQYYMSDPILDAKFTVGEVQIGIKYLKHGKSAGDDQILGEFISYGEQQFKYVIVDIFNELYESGHFLDQ